jgi:serine/threonine protein kinase
MPLSTGARLGPYEILSRAGAGGMGEVWKARDTRLDRTALKVLPPDLTSDPAALQRQGSVNRLEERQPSLWSSGWLQGEASEPLTQPPYPCPPACNPGTEVHPLFGRGALTRFQTAEAPGFELRCRRTVMSAFRPGCRLPIR